MVYLSSLRPLEASSVDENPLFEQVQDITYSCFEAEATMHMGIFSGRDSTHGPMKVGPHGTWDIMGPRGRSFSLFGWCGGIGNHLQAGGVPLPIALTGLEEGWTFTEGER